ncbi:hypothetical protein JKP88DRAFT_273442 [Tribonema minus]|uniref:Uncharacterized protein n=1 Tax=Tribonema minus TaxID=303371 RepID=A0A835YU57_9STRA|nr:hypothetical protein JKP88DRAFT_273442 [Tribonema minus]
MAAAAAVRSDMDTSGGSGGSGGSSGSSALTAAGVTVGSDAGGGCRRGMHAAAPLPHYPLRGEGAVRGGAGAGGDWGAGGKGGRGRRASQRWSLWRAMWTVLQPELREGVTESGAATSASRALLLPRVVVLKRLCDRAVAHCVAAFVSQAQLELGESVEFEFSPGATLRYWQLAVMGKARRCARARDRAPRFLPSLRRLRVLLTHPAASGDLVLMRTDDGHICWVVPSARDPLARAVAHAAKSATRAHNATQHMSPSSVLIRTRSPHAAERVKWTTGATGDLVLMRTDDRDIRWVAPGARGRLGGVRYSVRKFAARAVWNWKTARLSEHNATVASLPMEAHFDAAHLARRGPCVRCAAEVADDGTLGRHLFINFRVVVKEGKKILWQGAPPAPSLWQLTTEELYAQSEKTLEPGFRAGAKHALRGVMQSLAARFNLASEDADESGDVDPAASASSTSDSGDSSSWSAAADADDAAAATAAAAAAPADMPAHAVVAVARGAAATAADVAAHAAALEAHFLAVDRATAFSRDVASTASLDADLRLAADVGDLQEARGAAEDSAEAAAEEVAATSAAAAAAADIASDMRQRLLQWQRAKEQQQATPPQQQRRSLRDSCWQWLQEVITRAGEKNAAKAEEAAAHAAAAAAEAKQALRRVTAEGKRLVRRQLKVYDASMLLTGRLRQELFRLHGQGDQQWEAFEHQRQQLQRPQRLQRPEELRRELLRQQQQLDRDRAQRQKQQAKETRLLQKEQRALPRRQRRQQQREERRQRAQQERQEKQQQRQQRRQREAQRRAAEAHEREQQEQRTRQWLQRSAQEHGFSAAGGAAGVATAAQGDDAAAAAAATTNPDQFVPLAVLLLFALFRASIGEHRRRTIVAAAAVFVAVHAWALRAALLQHLAASDAYAGGMQPGQVYEAATEWVDL